jgi:hypothetical protein
MIRKSLFTMVFLIISALASPASAQDFIKAPNGTFWKIDAGLKRLFTSSESIEGHGLKESNATPVDAEKFESYPVGEPMPHRRKYSTTRSVGAQSWGEFRVPVASGWTLIGEPKIHNGGQSEIQNELDREGNVIAIKVRVYNPNTAFAGFGRSREIKVTAILERQ